MAWVRLIETARCRPAAGTSVCPGKPVCPGTPVGTDKPACGGTFVAFEGRELAVFLLEPANGSARSPGVAVIDNTCPHANGNLSAGTVDGTIVTCPTHRWRFDLTTGRCPESAPVQVRCYPAKIQDAAVWIDLAG